MVAVVFKKGYKREEMEGKLEGIHRRKYSNSIRSCCDLY